MVVEEFCLQQAVAHGIVFLKVESVVAWCPYGVALVGGQSLVVTYLFHQCCKVAELWVVADLLPQCLV